MNALAAFTRRSLKKNVSRTLVTILGITLSMIMLTAVTLGGYSGMKFYERVILESEGPYHGFWRSLTDEEVQAARKVPNQDKVSIWRELGFAEIDPEDDYKPYLQIFSVDKAAGDLVAIHLIQGRMPEKEGEILLPTTLDKLDNFSYAVGDSLLLTVGKREVDGKPASNDPYREKIDFRPGKEKLVDSRPMTFKVVGTYQRLSFDLLPVNMPAHVALTAGKADGPATYLFSFKDREEGFRAYQEWKKQARTEEGKPDQGEAEDKGLPGNLKHINYHSDLIRGQGGIGDSPIAMAIGTLATILIVIIGAATVSLIYNAFSISITERTRQYGMLKSIGATNRQILFSLLYEGLLVSLPAVVLGSLLGYLGLSVAFYLVRILVPEFSFLVAPGKTVQLEAVFNIMPLLLAAGLCILTTLIAAFLPARRAMKMSPIQALRMTKDVKLKARQIRSSGLWTRILGPEAGLAVKNQKRDRKHYRAAVVSLVLSVVLFVSASAYIGQAQSGIEPVTSRDTQADIAYFFWLTGAGQMADAYNQASEGKETPVDSLSHQEDLLKKMRSIPGVDRVNLSFFTEAYVLFPQGSHDKDMVAARRESVKADQSPDGFESIFLAQWDRGGSIREKIDLTFLDDADFRVYAASLGQDPNDYFEGKKIGGILYNRLTTYISQGEAASRQVRTSYLKDQKNLSVSVISPQVEAGYILPGLEKRPDGHLGYTYYPVSDEEGKSDKKEIRKAFEEVEKTRAVLISVMTDRLPLGSRGDRPTLFLPLSRVREIFPEKDLEIRDFTGSFSLQHQEGRNEEVMKEVEKIAQADPQQHDFINLRVRMDTSRRLITMISAFSYLFIGLVSAIVMANMFNAISTNMILRKRDFAILKTVGMDDGQMNRMLVVEGAYYGLSALIFAIPLSILASLAIAYALESNANMINYYIPWRALVIAIGSVALVVAVTIAYAKRKLDLENPMAWIKGESF